MSQTPGGEPAAEDNGGLPARLGEERLAASVVKRGMFGAETTGDTSGYGGLQVRKQPPLSSEPPYGGYFDAVAQALGSALEPAGIGFSDAIERVVVDRGEITFHVRRDKLVEVADKLLHDPALTRIEMPDDWHGHPQRKDYPLGGIPVEYRGTKVPPPDERRSYT